MNQTADGFDAIEYPLDYSFKAVCVYKTQADKAGVSGVEQKIQSVVADIVGLNAVKSVSSKISKAGNYISVTTTARLKNRDQLEKVYSVLSALDIVKMTL